MADIFVRSTDGLSTDDGSTWALAKDKIPAAPQAGPSATFVSKLHSETTAAAVTLTMAGTVSNPSKIICVDDTGDPISPSVTAASAAVATTGASNINIRGSGYVQGIAFIAGNGSNFLQINLNKASTGLANTQHYENCDFNLLDAHGSSFIQIGSDGGADLVRTKLTNCRLKLAAASQYILLASTVHINGGSFIAGSAAATALFQLGSSAKDTNVLIENFDFSNLSAALNLFKTPASGGVAILRNIKMPPAWSGSLVSGAINPPNWRAEAYNLDSGATNYKFWIETCEGTLKHETVIVKTGGASDGTTPKSLKMTSSANANELTSGLASPLISDWIDTTGTAKTVTVDIIHDSATALTDAEVWLEVDYLGSSATPQGTKASSKRATILTTAANVTTSTATWTTTGLTAPNKQKLAVTFTPQMKGEFLARVVLAKASKTIYVDPVAQVS